MKGALWKEVREEVLNGRTKEREARGVEGMTKV